ncbi:DUF6264 family protein [Microbacterium sp. NPDC058345]|uniref:DUF6264 family protein n=1 Tax=Microbacterium sp. NPDC058345 TaxID=3346455 RepID=UPI00364FE6F8
MTDDRPQYGEYATPEQQRAAAGLPPALPEQPAPALAAPQAQRNARSPHRVDRLITAALLGFGLVNVLTSVPGFLDLAMTMNRTLQILGLDGEFTSFSIAKVWGAIATVVMIAGYAATVWLAVRRVRTARLAWWVPLVGFVITMALVSACIAVPMFGDPAFTQGLTPPAG